MNSAKTQIQASFVGESNFSFMKLVLCGNKEFAFFGAWLLAAHFFNVTEK